MVAFKKILFPTDFSINADKALAHAIRLADFDGGEVIVQHVVGNYFEKHPHWATLFDLHEMQKYMDTYVDAHMTKILPKDTDWRAELLPEMYPDGQQREPAGVR